MANPILTASLVRLRSDLNTRFPFRRKDSDGWIGDLAHQTGSSGHNPDESGRGEYEDADSVDEVRAIDIDKDLGGPNTPRSVMWAVIYAVIATPADRNRLRYVIFNGRIASASAGWVWRDYYGDNRHDEHAHFSGNPSNDEDASAWRSVLDGVPTTVGGIMAGEAADRILTTLSGGNAIGTAYLRLLQGTEHEGPTAKPLFPHSLKGIHGNTLAILAAIELQTAAFNGLADAINGAHGSVDVAAISATLDRALNAAVDKINLETRDAVADLGEGGAGQVRADD